ncbi:hypothetical protein RIF29_19795 [Crotalaria pallida]|uniref:Uncharacterized protein n=1 Tax=Crotalaria pallida TaxID=3830 RepID=A0AAN9IBR6_CROPI
MNGALSPGAALNSGTQGAGTSGAIGLRSGAVQVGASGAIGSATGAIGSGAGVARDSNVGCRRAHDADGSGARVLNGAAELQAGAADLQAGAAVLVGGVAGAWTGASNNELHGKGPQIGAQNLNQDTVIMQGNGQGINATKIDNAKVPSVWDSFDIKKLRRSFQRTGSQEDMGT